MQLLLHLYENNTYSQRLLETNRKALTKNCETLLQALLRGERLSGRDVVLKYDMTEYRRRFLDLKENGIDVRHTTDGRCHVWYLPDEEIKRLKL